jgi:hypothetical protein
MEVGINDICWLFGINSRDVLGLLSNSVEVQQAAVCQLIKLV